MRLLQDDILGHLYKIIAHYPFLSTHIIYSNHLLRLIMEDEKHPNLSIKMMKITQRAVQVNRYVIILQCILDYPAKLGNYFPKFWPDNPINQNPMKI